MKETSAARTRLQQVVSHPYFERAVVAAIVFNAVTLALETYPAVMAAYGRELLALDKVFIVLFVAELVLRMVAYGKSFFRGGWNWFDFAVVAVTLLPFVGVSALGNVSAIRAVRVLRLLSVVPAFRNVLAGIGRALAGSFAVMCVLTVILYVFAVMSVKFFRTHAPEYFSDLDTAFFTLFQIMTLDAWSDVVRPLMAVYPWASLFFVAFIVVTVFILLSIVIGVASSAISGPDDERKERALEEQLAQITATLNRLMTK